MQAELRVERIERRLSPDEVSDADWLRTETDTTADGQLRIVESCRYSDDDVAVYGGEQVQAWIDADHRRREGLQRDWWFLDAAAVAVIGVHTGDERIGEIEVASSHLGGIESDAPVDHLLDVTADLFAELKDELRRVGLTVPDAMDGPLVPTESWLVQTP
jgi:hypothetical protein